MDRILTGLLLISLLAAMTGCTLCQSTEDGTYAAYGGRWPRHDPMHGRVGSPLSATGDPVLYRDGPIWESAADIAAEEGLYKGVDDPPPPPPSLRSANRRWSD